MTDPDTAEVAAEAIRCLARAEDLARAWADGQDTDGTPLPPAARSVLAGAAKRLAAAIAPGDGTPRLNIPPTPEAIAAVLDILAPQTPMPGMPAALAADAGTIRVPVILFMHDDQPVWPGEQALHGLAEHIAAAVLNTDAVPFGSAGTTDADSGGATYDLATGRVVPPITGRATSGEGWV